MKGITRYSDKVPGSRGNYGLAVRFDKTDGYVGITQFGRNVNTVDRILLSPKQFAALVEFAARRK